MKIERAAIALKLMCVKATYRENCTIDRLESPFPIREITPLIRWGDIKIVQGDGVRLYTKEGEVIYALIGDDGSIQIKVSNV